MEERDVDPWRKASYSAEGGGNCVEVGRSSGEILVRDTKNHGRGPVLRLTPADWRRLTSTL